METESSLAKLVGLSNALLTNSGNSAIFAALHLCRLAGKTKVLIPHEGSWFSYKHLPGLLGMEIEEIHTDYALLNLEDLRAKLDNKAVVLFATLGAYAVLEPIEQIIQLSHKAGALVIGDISGTIGMSGVNHCLLDFAVASFGHNKPLEVGYGGMIASNGSLSTPVLLMAKFPEFLIEKLQAAMDSLQSRYEFLFRKRQKFLPKLNLLGELAHPGLVGINLLIKHKPKEVIEFCKANNLPFLLCPRYHRVREKAISIELKRLRKKA